ncbi:MAG TPA: ribonuclease P protein component [Actinomycetota bacterium]|jgi:ribonuclease P protein component|nr:ribonuclease P protein component [Actinomycetota bacterium]
MAEGGPQRRATLPRAERLRVPAEFQRLFERGARIERAAFVLLWIRAPGRRAAGFAAGRRLGGSVVRNRARRRLREAYRRESSALPPEGLRVCFLARPSVLRMSFGDLSAAVGSALAEVGRIQTRQK